MTVLTVLVSFAWLFFAAILTVVDAVWTVVVAVLACMTSVAKKIWYGVEAAKASCEVKWETFKSEHNF